MKKCIFLLLLLCTGCAGINFRQTNNHIYISGTGIPTITDDNEFGKGLGSQYRVMLNGKLEFQYKYNF